MWLILAMAGCIYVSSDQQSAYVDSGRDSAAWCDSDYDCGEDEVCVVGWCDPECTSDDDCAGNFACDTPNHSSADAWGCLERCDRDTECKAGFVCDSSGDCVSP